MRQMSKRAIMRGNLNGVVYADEKFLWFLLLRFQVVIDSNRIKAVFEF